MFIVARNLAKRYPSGEGVVHAVRDISLGVTKGEFVAVIGESGAGKSTLLSLLGGLDRPSGGSLTVDGIDVVGLTEEQLAVFRSEYLGFVFQSFQLLPYLTALENVLLPLAIAPMKNREKKDTAREALRRVGIEDKSDRLPHQLSGGEQERVAIARAIVNRPLIILADEPTGNLDTKNGQAIMALLRELSSQGITLVMVTHNQGYAAYADRMIRLADGRVVS